MIPTDMERLESEIASVLSDGSQNDGNEPTAAIDHGPTTPSINTSHELHERTLPPPIPDGALAVPAKPAESTAPEQCSTYEMVQIPAFIAFDEIDHTGKEAATLLQNLVDPWAKRGWEFYRVDSFKMHTLPGCIPAFGGDRAHTADVHVVTFRKKV
jgi:hypothetical protein